LSASAHFSGLRAIVDLKGLSRRILVYTGARTLKSKDGIDGYPLDTFLPALADNTLWSR